jgi:twitching motility protein PilT
MDFDALLTEGVKRGASDFHLKPGTYPILRLKGALCPQTDLPPITGEVMEDVALRVLGDFQYAELKDGKELDLAYAVPGVGRFRVNLFMANGDLRGVLRVIPTRIPSFEELHLPIVLEKLAMERRGMILVTGVTGSGKTTTLAAMIDYMNDRRNDHIITIEDPIEFLHEDKDCVISQREIGHDSFNFVQALRAALRQDPDIILVGEMRDAETMSIAIQAAETGHLVLSTLHTLNATETVNRIISTFPPHQEAQIRDQLAAVIRGIISQRLMPRLDGQGRVPAVEVMLGTALIRDSIRESGKTPGIPAVIAAGHAQYGMQTFDQSLLALYRQELITYEVARENASNPEDFDLRVKGILSAAEMTWEAGAKEETARQDQPAAADTPSGSFFKKR